MCSTIACAMAISATRRLRLHIARVVGRKRLFVLDFLEYFQQVFGGLIGHGRINED